MIYAENWVIIHHIMQKFTLTAPDDWHCHLRDGAYLSRTVADTSERFRRAVVMPNLLPPVRTVQEAMQYRERILAAVPEGHVFTPLMTLYLTKETRPEEIFEAKKSGVVIGAKLYPAGATTHSSGGVRNVADIYPVLEAMQRCDLPLLIHGEITDPLIDVIAREAVFIDTELSLLVRDFPALRMVLEHISTRAAVEYVTGASKNVAATITAHHLLLNLNDLLADGIRPHYYCKPIVKYIADQMALIDAAISGNPKFFLGTDSAPHSQSHKECAVGCAGIYTAHAAIELYAEVFAQHRALHQLENFASRFGAMFYKLPVNTERITLIREPWTVPDSFTMTASGEKMIPFWAGKTLDWKIMQ